MSTTENENNEQAVTALANVNDSLKTVDADADPIVAAEAASDAEANSNVESEQPVKIGKAE